jgi:hypothetical protein
MSTPISYVNISAPMPLCSTDDVLNLIGSVMPIANDNFTTSQIAAAIPPAQRYVENACNRKFAPHRDVYQFDGNGTSRAVIKHRPFININQLSVYFVYPMNLCRVAYDYQLMTDHGAGIISFPLFYGAAQFAPFAFKFEKGSRNITLDLQVGYSEELFGQSMTTEDNQTFTFPESNVVNKSMNTTPDYSVPPIISPIIYLNGTALTNTTYVWVDNDPLGQGQWQIETDNILYTVNSDSTGITSITFNSPLSGNPTITADFAYAYIPDDINEAVTKQAAIRCLTSMAAGWYGNQFDGLAQTQSEGTRIELHNSGRFGHQIDLWNQDIANIISVNQRIALGSIGSAFNPNTEYGY